MSKKTMVRAIRRVLLIAIVIVWGGFVAMSNGDEEPGTVFCNAVVCEKM